MGELAASLAHELNQPLTAILSNAQAAQRFLASDSASIEEVREILKDIVDDDNRAGEVIRRMRALVKKEKIEFAALDLGNVISDVVLLTHSDAILHNIRVVMEANSRHCRRARALPRKARVSLPPKPAPSPRKRISGARRWSTTIASSTRTSSTRATPNTKATGTLGHNTRLYTPADTTIQTIARREDSAQYLLGGRDC